MESLLTSRLKTADTAYAMKLIIFLWICSMSLWSAHRQLPRCV